MQKSMQELADQIIDFGWDESFGLHNAMDQQDMILLAAELGDEELRRHFATPAGWEEWKTYFKGRLEE